MTRETPQPKIDAASHKEVIRMISAETPAWEIDRWLTHNCKITWREAVRLRRKITQDLRQEIATPAEPEQAEEEFPF